MKRVLISLFISLLIVNPFYKGFFILERNKKGDYATCFVESFNDRFNWISRFNMVEIGGVGDEIQKEKLDKLKDRGVKVLFYDWLPAGYHYLDGEDNELMKWVFENRYLASLNPDGPFPHCESMGYSWCREYYFDFGLNSVIEKKGDFLLNFFNRFNYDGVFFDWASGRFIEDNEYRPIRENFKRKHPEKGYLECIGEFYKNLRYKIEDKLIITNQGFRNKENVLKWADYDMTESYGTDYNYFGKRIYLKDVGFVDVPQTIYFPVSDDFLKGSLDDTIYYLNYLRKIRDEFKDFGFKNFIYMNYAAPEFSIVERKNGLDIYEAKTPRDAIFFGYALSRLCNFISYTEVPFDHSLEEDDIYFYDLGKPLGENYEHIDGGYVRFYTKGFVVVGDWQDEVNLTLSSKFLKEGYPVYDLYKKEWIGKVKNRSITINIKPHYDELTGKMAPSGRVFLYPNFFPTPYLIPLTIKKRNS